MRSLLDQFTPSHFLTIAFALAALQFAIPVRSLAQQYDSAVQTDVTRFHICMTDKAYRETRIQAASPEVQEQLRNLPKDFDAMSLKVLGPILRISPKRASDLVSLQQAALKKETWSLDLCEVYRRVSDSVEFLDGYCAQINPNSPACSVSVR